MVPLKTILFFLLGGIEFLRRQVILTICLFLAVSGTSQAAQVQATVDRNRISAGESINLTITVTGGAGTVDLSAIRDFKVAGTSSGTSIRIVNGQVTKQARYNYVLVPMGHGRLTIPPLAVVSDGRTYRTGKIVVQVSREPRERADTGDLFVQAVVRDPEIYAGQQTVYTLRFLQAVQAVNIQLQKPEFTGFTVKQLEGEKRHTTVVSGRQYQVTELSFLLIPNDAGQITIEPALLRCDVVRRKRPSGGSFFDDPFFGRSELRPRNLKTDPITVTVKPLPPYSGRTEFSGLVGKFDIRADLEDAEINVGDATTLSVTVEGTGNIMDAVSPKVQIPDAFKVYDDTPEEEISLGAAGFSGRKVFRNALVALRDGAYDVGPFNLCYFDVALGDYRVVTAPPVSLQAAAVGETAPVQVFKSTEIEALPKITKKKVEFTGHDILPLKEGADALEDRSPLTAGLFFLLLTLPVMLFLIVRVVVAVTNRDADTGKILARRALDALKMAENSQGRPDDFLSHLHTSLIAAVRSLSGTPGESLTGAEVREIFSSNGSDADLANRAAVLLEKIESAGYSGMNHPTGQREQLVNEVRTLVKKIC